jgi:hypothetical protein
MAWVFAVGPILRKVCRITGPALAMQEYCVRKVLRGLSKNSRTVARGDQADRPTGLVTVAIAIASGFDFSAFCKAGRSPRPAFSTGSNFEQVQRQANYATACSLEISPADPVWMPVIRKTFTRAEPYLTRRCSLFA